MSASFIKTERTSDECFLQISAGIKLAKLTTLPAMSSPPTTIKISSETSGKLHSLDQQLPSTQYNESNFKIEPPKLPDYAPSQPSTATFECEFCSQDFNLKASLIRHVLESHNYNPGGGPLKQEFVQTLSPQQSSESSLESKQEFEPTVPSENHFQCDTCSNVFDSQTDLQRHLMGHINSGSSQSETHMLSCTTEKPLRYYVNQ
eukprot:8123_1